MQLRPAVGRRRGARGGRLALVPLLAFLAPAAAALETLPVSADQPITELRRTVDVLEDPGGTLTFEEILREPVAARFSPNSSGRELSFGNTTSAYWFRFRLANPEPEAVQLLLKISFPLLDRIELHTSGRPPLVIGDSLPFSERPIRARHFLVPLTLPAASSETFHLRVTTAGLLVVPLEIGGLEPLLARTHRDQLVLGLLYGVFAGALIYNLFLWLSLRDAVNLYLVGHIAAIGMLIASIDGLAFQLWPRATGWQQWASHTTVLMVTVFTLLFIRSLVDSARNAPRLDRALKLALWIQLAVAAVSIAGGPHAFLGVVLGGLILIFALLAVTVVWHAWRGHRAARIYSIAWVVFLLILTFGASAALGILPGFLDFLLLARFVGALEVLLAAVSVATNLHEARRALSASEEKFSRAFRSSPDMLTLSRLDDGRFLEVNETFERISGFRRAEAIGRTAAQLGLWPDDARRELIDALARGGSVRQSETVILDRNSRRIPVQVSAERIELDGEPVLLATVRDITERVQAAQHRERLIRELETKNTELERFTYTASHDLRSPLVTILGFLGVLEKDLERGDRRRFRIDLERIRSAASHMRRLLDELLELSRIGRVVEATQRVPLTVVAREAAALLQRAIRERQVDLHIAPDLPIVRGDRTRLLQVLQNLLDNAVRYLGDQAEPRIEVGWRRDGEDLVCFVRDNGIGIEARDHEIVFELFRRLQPGVEGTGVGLSLARRIVESHGGRIWVESEGAGTGSTFCFVLPAAAA